MASPYAEAFSALTAFLATAIVAAASLGAGALFIRFLPASFSRVEKFVYAALGGMGLLSFTLFLVGQFSFHRSIILAILFISIVVLAYEVFSNRSQLSQI